MVLSKGQVISKRFLGSSISSKKPTKKFVFTTMRIVFVRFLEEIDDLKKHFEINWPLELFEIGLPNQLQKACFVKYKCSIAILCLCYNDFVAVLLSEVWVSHINSSHEKCFRSISRQGMYTQYGPITNVGISQGWEFFIFAQIFRADVLKGFRTVLYIFWNLS